MKEYEAVEQRKCKHKMVKKNIGWECEWKESKRRKKQTLLLRVVQLGAKRADKIELHEEFVCYSMGIMSCDNLCWRKYGLC